MSILFKIVSESIDAAEKAKRKKAYKLARTGYIGAAFKGGTIGAGVGAGVGAYNAAHGKSKPLFKSPDGTEWAPGPKLGAVLGATKGSAIGSMVGIGANAAHNAGAKSGIKGKTTKYAAAKGAAMGLGVGLGKSLLNKKFDPLSVGKYTAAGALAGHMYKKGQDAGKRAMEDLK